MHQHHSASADAAHLWIEDALDESARDRRIDRVPPTPHDLESDLSRLRLRADDDGHGLKLDQPTSSDINVRFFIPLGAET